MMQLQADSDLNYIFLAYLNTALRRQRSKYMQKLQRQTEFELSLEDMDQLADTCYVECDLDYNATAELLCVDISERDCRIVHMHAILGIELCAIAEMLEISVSASQKAYQRALAKMRVTVGAYE